MGKNDFCCAHGCSNNRKRNPELHFYRIPKELSRRKAWLQRIRRDNFTPTVNTRLCSGHFAGGVKSDDPQAHGFIPSIFKHTHSTSKTPRSSKNSLRCDNVENIAATRKPKRRKRGLPVSFICFHEFSNTATVLIAHHMFVVYFNSREMKSGAGQNNRVQL